MHCSVPLHSIIDPVVLVVFLCHSIHTFPILSRCSPCQGSPPFLEGLGNCQTNERRATRPLLSTLHPRACYFQCSGLARSMLWCITCYIWAGIGRSLACSGGRHFGAVVFTSCMAWTSQCPAEDDQVSMDGLRASRHATRDIHSPFVDCGQ